MKTVVLKVDGMTCGGCVKSVTRVLEGQKGVSNVEVSLEKANATVEFDETVIDADELADAVEDAGYDAQVQS
ncbi:copper-binding protein [Pelistega indica]|uniref:Copper-binding protein n=1 Tax=Pelistega indica TaxID=1414851 RepID=V8GA79_9BURK|nr:MULTISPECIES: heavy-metal-associated domain-containing protein [Pelistega]ETD72858.1 copper-binding protein [Pelistega indica]